MANASLCRARKDRPPMRRRDSCKCWQLPWRIMPPAPLPKILVIRFVDSRATYPSWHNGLFNVRERECEMGRRRFQRPQLGLRRDGPSPLSSSAVACGVPLGQAPRTVRFGVAVWQRLLAITGEDATAKSVQQWVYGVVCALLRNKERALEHGQLLAPVVVQAPAGSGDRYAVAAQVAGYECVSEWACAVLDREEVEQGVEEGCELRSEVLLALSHLHAAERHLANLAARSARGAQVPDCMSGHVRASDLLEWRREADALFHRVGESCGVVDSQDASAGESRMVHGGRE